MRFTKRLICILIAILLLAGTYIPASAEAEASQATILFTHDLHSHLLPALDEDGGEYGGYARLMEAINEQRSMYPEAILVDGGDFSMGSLFQTAFTTSAIELRMMGAMGYDATTFGNHEFDYLPSGLAAMLNVAAASGDPVPSIVEANYLPPLPDNEAYTEDSRLMWDALNNYGVSDYILLERGGIYYAIFGINGFNSDDCAPNSGMILEDPALVAQEVVDRAKAKCQEVYGVSPLVVCLSHSGTSDGKGEDYELAQKVNGIHLIVSGHTHTTLTQPIAVNGTFIVSAGEYGRNLGVVQMSYSESGEVSLKDYQLIPIDQNVPEDPEIAALTEGFKAAVEKDYLSRYEMSFDQVLTKNPYVFDTVDQVYATAHESTLGNLFSDAYLWAAENASGENVDIALTASGVIRESIPVGDVTVSDVFNAASLGVGTEGELVSVYITGADLKNALEIDATLSDIMTSARLYFSGIEYSANTNRMLLNKVDYAMLRCDDGSLTAIQDDKLYHIICGMYMAQMLGNVQEMSFGLITITPRTADGDPIAVADLAQHVVRDEAGTPIKEWYAIASYLDEMGESMDSRYSETDGRKVVYSSWSPVDLLRNANAYTFIALGVIVA